jgi:hypothetical protein
LRGRRIEVVTVGYNPNLQLVGSDPIGTANDIGLFIGPNGTHPSTSPRLRQMYMLCQKQFNVHQRARLIGFRQLLTIGSNLPSGPTTQVTDTANLPAATIDVVSTTGFPAGGGTAIIVSANGPQTVTFAGITPTSLTGAAGGTGALHPGSTVMLLSGATYPLETPVSSAFWKFTDGNVLWGIRRIVDPTIIGNVQDGYFTQSPTVVTPVKFRWSTTPAQLFETIDEGTGVITPPWGGDFPGNILSPELGRMNDLRTSEWDIPSSCDALIEGPCNIAFYASVQQTNPSTRLQPPPATISPFSTTLGVTREDSFVQTFPNSTYIRIAGSLIFEMEDWVGEKEKTYRRPSDADRIVRQGTRTNDPSLERPADDTSDYEACGKGGRTS